MWYPFVRRVIERSDVVVQILDARNPLMYRSADLEAYVKEVDPQKRFPTRPGLFCLLSQCLSPLAQRKGYLQNMRCVVLVGSKRKKEAALMLS